MASGFSNTFANTIIDHLLRNQAFTPVATVYVALFTTIPTRSTAGTEVSGGSYARQSVTLSAGAAGLSDNTNLLTYPTATADWGTVVGIGLMSASTAGTLYWFGNLTANKTVGNGTTFSIAIGDIDLDAAA